MNELAGTTALVTGASRGIGLATAQALATAGARVAMVARSASDLAARAAEIGDAAIALACDVADSAAVDRLVHDVKQRFAGAPNVLVNNAGVFTLATLDQMAADDFRRALDVNLLAPFLLIRAFLGDMKARGHGHIVTIGSVADHAVFPENGAYSASKFGVRALHEVLRAELRGTGAGVRATLVSPSAVDTPLWDDVSPDTRPGFTPRREMLAPAAVADAVLYAVSRPPGVTVDELRLSHS
jgi:NADP-dependent 3-hydroxy acid dehydrogenase YdfG